MSPQRIFGIVLIVLGVILVSVGMSASHSIADQVSNTFTGRFTRETVGYLIAGGLAIVSGLFMVLFNARGKSA